MTPIIWLKKQRDKRICYVSGREWSERSWLTVAGMDDSAPMRGLTEMIDFVARMIERYPQNLARAENVSDLRRAFLNKRTAILMAIEGGSQIENSLVALRPCGRSIKVERKLSLVEY